MNTLTSLRATKLRFLLCAGIVLVLFSLPVWMAFKNPVSGLNPPAGCSPPGQLNGTSIVILKQLTRSPEGLNLATRGKSVLGCDELGMGINW